MKFYIVVLLTIIISTLKAQTAEPTINASGIVFSNITETSMTISWTNGNGSSRIVVCRESELLANTYPVDGASYSFNTNYPQAPGLGSNKIVYNGSGNSFTMTGLTLNRPYAIGIMEYNGTGTATNYYPAYVLSATRTPGGAPEPTVPSSGISIKVVSVPEYAVEVKWTKGNGDGRIVMVRDHKDVVSGFPVDGFGYSANDNFNLAPWSGPNRIVYNGTGDSFVLRGISPTEWYGLTIFEYNGQGNPINYWVDGRLNSRVVIQSQASRDQQTILDNLSFQYRYDSRNRVIAKKVPGAGWVYLVYDNRDRLVLTQDANQRPANRWSFTKYDALNRPVLTGMMTAAARYGLDHMQKNVDDFYAAGGSYFESFVGSASGNVHGYSNISYPSVSDANSYLTVSYYDNYDFKDLWGADYDYHNEGLSGLANGVTYDQSAAENPRVIGQITGNMTKVLDGGITGGIVWNRSVNFYDEKYRVIQSVSDNYRGGYDRTSNLYDFAGKLLTTRTTHFGITWKDKTGVARVGSGIKKTISTTDWNAGCASVELLPADQSGWVEFAPTSSSNALMVGISSQNAGAGWTSINHALYVTGAGTLQVRENGGATNYMPSNATYAANNILRIEINRQASKIRYFRNGTLLLERPVAAVPFLIDVSMYATASEIRNVRSSFGLSSAEVITRRFDYDHAGRLLKTFHKIGTNQEVLLSENKYNELGQLIDKNLHVVDNTPKQSVDYRYNIRGWLTSINNSALSEDNGVTNDDSGDLFGMQLAYNQDIGLGNPALFNGNIGATKWSNNLGLGAVKENAYLYDYDQMNRLKSADFKEKTTSWPVVPGEKFKETISSYDLNGNILFLDRNDERGNEGAMDRLKYNYGTTPTTKTNRLLGVDDDGDDLKGFKEANGGLTKYAYDANGNMFRDFSKFSKTVLLNGDFAEGGTNWQISDPSKISFQDGIASVATGTAAVTMTQSTLKATTSYILRLVCIKTSTTGSISASVGGTAVAVSPGNTEYYIVSGSTAALTLTFSASFTGTVDKIEVLPATSITYNYLNLPEIVTQGQEYLRYIYDASGRKLGQELHGVAGITKKTDYSGEFIYENDTLKFINHEEGRIIPEQDGGFTYQYHLKDHLGNVRLTFTTKEEVESAIATLEDEDATTEAGQFLYYDEAVKVKSKLFDHTNDGLEYNPEPCTLPGCTPDPGPPGAEELGTGHATRLSGYENERYGLAKSLSVMPGDVVRIEVFAKYIDPVVNNWTYPLTDLMQQIEDNVPGVLVDGGAIGSIGTGTVPFTTLFTKSSTGDAPMAYLHYVMTDRDADPLMIGDDLDMSQSNFVQVTEAARENGSNGPHEHLFAEVVVKQPGLMYIYLSNDNLALGGDQVDVFFDDFKVEHVKGPVVQMDDYYPFGLTFNSYRTENSVENKIRFQGQEHIDDLGLNWDSFKWRNHDPAIGRFFGVDPIAEKYYYNSPYAFSENKVIAHVELEGLEAHGLRGDWENKIINGFKYVVEGDAFVDLSKAVTNWVSNNQQKDNNTPTPDMTVTIVTDGPSGPNANNLPKAADQSQNVVVPQNLIDALGSFAKGGPPGSRGSGQGGPNEGGQPAPTTPVGEAVSGTTSAAVPGGQAASEVFKPSTSDSVIHIVSDSTNRMQTQRTAESVTTGETKTKIIDKPIWEVNN